MDTLLRQVALLRLIPREPFYSATSTLLSKLAEQGFSVSQRTVQRDLNNLSIPFALQSQADGSRMLWSYKADAPLDLSAMDTPTALALYLAESHLNTLLPQVVLDKLTLQFNRARNHLNSLQGNGLAYWARHVRAVPNGKVLQPAQVKPEVWQNVSTALIERRQLEIGYRSRSKSAEKTLVLHPVGLVSRHSISYLIATANGYQDQRQYALHRITTSTVLDAPAQGVKDWDIDGYIEGGLFDNSSELRRTTLVAEISPQIAWLLSETPLSSEQTIEAIPDRDWKRLSAVVPKDQETFWWIFGLGENIRVHEPADWVDEIKNRLERMGQLYGGAQ